MAREGVEGERRERGLSGGREEEVAREEVRLREPGSHGRLGSKGSL